MEVEKARHFTLVVLKPVLLKPVGENLLGRREEPFRASLSSDRGKEAVSDNMRIPKYWSGHDRRRHDLSSQKQVIAIRYFS